jgi:hypothetical protein
MTHRHLRLRLRFLPVLLLGAFSLCALLPGHAVAQPSPAAVAAFNAYTGVVESRLAAQHRSQDSFLAHIPADAEASAGTRLNDRLLHGQVIIERIPVPAHPGLSGAALYHWRGTAFAPGATVAQFERLLKNFASYPRNFAPQVLSARLLGQQGDRLRATMRVRQQHVLTVVLDTDYDIDYGRLDARHGYSVAHSTRIAEIASPGTPAEHVLDASYAHGFLWRQNTYWSYEQRDGGLYMQIESVSLTRAIPLGLGWAIGPYVESIPRDSLEFTLRAAILALGKQR